MIEILLREAMESYEAHTGERLTYAELAERTGLSRATIKSIAAREGYNASLRTIDLLCDTLRSEPAALLRSRPAGNRRANR